MRKIWRFVGFVLLAGLLALVGGCGGGGGSDTGSQNTNNDVVISAAELVTDGTVNTSSVQLVLPKDEKFVASEVTIQSFSVDESSFTQEGGVVMAENVNGRTSLLGYSLVGDSTPTEISLRSTATTLILMICGSELDTAQKSALIPKIQAHAKFGTLVSLFEVAYSVDQYFLESIAEKQDLVALIREISDDISTQLETQNIVISTMAVNVSHRNWSESWTWYTDLTEPHIWDSPFLATADTGTRVALGNPTMVNYTALLYDDTGNELNWFITPRNSTLIQKNLFNGDAARRELNLGTEIDYHTTHLVYERTPASQILNVLHLASGVVGVFSDASMIKVIADTIGKGKAVLDVVSCSGALLSSIDFANSTPKQFAKSLLGSTGTSILETTLTSCIIPTVVDQLKSTTSEISKALTKSIGKAAIKSSNPLGWAMMVFDLSNELGPFVTSWTTSDNYVGYDLTWSGLATLSDVVANDTMPSASVNSAPTAQFLFSPSSPEAGQVVTFTNLSTDPDADILSWYWTFGDGGTSTLKNPTHTYTLAGNYQVGLEATDLDGATNKSTQYYTVAESTSGGGTDPGTDYIHDRFRVTDGTYAHDENNDNACKTEFGSGYRLADWNDVVAYYNSGASMSAFFTDLGLPSPSDAGARSLHVSRNGTEMYSSDRHYFITRHDHNKPGSYLAHSNIDNYLVSLGSWYGSRPALCYNEGAATSTPGTVTSYQNFALTSETYDPASDLNNAVVNELGSAYRVADWNDLVAYYNSGGDLVALLDGLGFGWDSLSAFVTRSGSIQYSTSRYYFIARHDHHMPTSYSFLSHADIDNHLLDLGSWSGNRKILAVKVNTVTTPNTVTSATGRVWMDRNLGASQVATAYNDAAAYGDLYQWGRGTDGHEKRTSPTTTNLSSSDSPGHGSFILISSSPWDWRSPQNDTLWQGVSGTNNPCPVGFRLPTIAEWEAEVATWSTKDAFGAFASPLKLVAAGDHDSYDDSIGGVLSNGFYWSSSVDGVYARYLDFRGSPEDFAGTTSSTYRADGFSVRCLKD